jgi:hypothetical protein
MKTLTFKSLMFIVAIALASTAAFAAGPLRLLDSKTPRPYLWDTSRGPIPVYTDGGGAFTYDFDGVTPFITIQRANEITAFSFNEWSKVPTSTFKAAIAGTIESKTGIADVTAANATQFYGVENGYGFWVLYDTDGSILQNYFGVPRTSVLGIAFPEIADENGQITEATAVMNGWAVWNTDLQGNNIAGVFTHEIGHAINLAHTQVNGQLVYYSQPSLNLYPGVPGCVQPVHNWRQPDGPGVNRANPAIVETMYPTIDNRRVVAQEQSTVTHPDDMASISNLYPTADYRAKTGSITGVLRLKDGKTPYSGINVVARNVANPLNDAVSALTGDYTQGRIGPDGRFTINNLTPGQDYVLYSEAILVGGFSTAPQLLISQAEYWNSDESNDPVGDTPCKATTIRAEAGVTKTADLTFNGYMQGVQYTPIVQASLSDLAKNGKSAGGSLNRTAFIWDEQKGFEVLPSDLLVTTASMTRNGQSIVINKDYDGDGISQASLRSSNGSVISLGDLNGDTCGGSNSIGAASSYGWAVDDSGNTVVGTAYVDRNNDGSCESNYRGEVVPFLWDAKKGMRQLDLSNVNLSTRPWVRAHAISGNGEVVLGSSNFVQAYAWVNSGPLVNLYEKFAARDAYANSHDGRRVAMSVWKSVGSQQMNGVALWDHATDTVTNIGALNWCDDVPFATFEGDLCKSPLYGPNWLNATFGTPVMLVSDMNDDGTVMIGRAGNLATGFVGAIWIDGLGWMSWDRFFAKQGVVEAKAFPLGLPSSISGSGTRVVGRTSVAPISFLADMSQVFVCKAGLSTQVGFPNGLRDAVGAGAEFGRCEFLK